MPPASNYAGSGGGDGWAVALSSTAVYNVFHHASTLQVACHLQSNASTCWNTDPETITDTNGNNFATSGQPGLWLDQSTGKLYVYATRTSDGTGGVVCIDTTTAATNTDPFCGFTALTAVGAAPLYEGISAISDPAVVGAHWYAFNYVNGGGVTSGGENELLCFDLTTFKACGTPFYEVVAPSDSTTADGDYPPPGVAAFGSQVVVPITIGATDELACFNASTSTACSGTWPVTLGFSYDSSYGTPFPLLTASGTLTGLCLPANGATNPTTGVQAVDPCYSLAGASVATPANMASAIAPTSGWNGPAVTIGPRVYVPDGNAGAVDCYDYSASAGCANFPKVLSNLSLLYTVNPDPQRATCLWVNSDGGADQIQNFDAYTGGACGQGPVRVLASSVVVPTPLCTPLSYSSLQVTSPAPSAYKSGSVTFDDGDGNPLPNIPAKPLDATGTVSLTGLNLGSGTGLPEFLITLNGTSGTPSAVTVKLTWTGTYDPSCVKSGTTVNAKATALTTSLSGGGKAGTVIMVPAGAAVTDSATLTGTNAATATGSVTYNVYSDSKCTKLAATGGKVSVSAGKVPKSAAVTLIAGGTYYWTASYSGDATNLASASTCGSVKVTVLPLPSVDTVTTADGRGTATAGVSTTTAGDLLVAFVGGRGPASGHQSATVSGTVTWHFVGRENAGAGDTEIWTATSGGILHDASVKVTAKTGGYPITVAVVAFKHAVGTGTVATATATSGAPKATLKTTHNVAWVFALAGDWTHSVQPKTGSGQFVVSQVTDSAETYWVQAPTMITGTAGTSVTINDTTPTHDPWNLIVTEVY